MAASTSAYIPLAIGHLVHIKVMTERPYVFKVLEYYDIWSIFRFSLTDSPARSGRTGVIQTWPVMVNRWEQSRHMHLEDHSDTESLIHQSLNVIMYTTVNIIILYVTFHQTQNKYSNAMAPTDPTEKKN